MKNIALLLLGISSLLSSLFTLVSGLAMKSLWRHILADEPLPVLTNFGINYGFIFVFIVGLLSIILHFKIGEAKKEKTFVLISIIQILYLPLIVCTYFIPMTTITWSLGG